MNGRRASVARHETRTFAFAGVEAMPVRVSAGTASGLPSFTVAGMDGMSGRSAAARVRAAFAGMGLSLPARRVFVEVSIAGAPLAGAHHDLPVALCVLAAMGVLPRKELSWYAALGELAPDGGLVAVPGVLSAAVGAAAAIRGCVVAATVGRHPAILRRVRTFLGSLVPSMAWCSMGRPDTSPWNRRRRLHHPHAGATVAVCVGRARWPLARVRIILRSR